MAGRALVIAADRNAIPGVLWDYLPPADVLVLAPRGAQGPIPISPAVAVAAVRDSADSAALLTISSLRKRFPQMPILVLPAHGSEHLAVAAFRAGATNYYRAPDEIQELIELVTGILGAGAVPTETGNEMVGESQEMRETVNRLRRIAASDSNVLLTGETGTGKDLAARFLHQHSRRRERELVALNCAAIPDSLLESELFGYGKGAFTGAHAAMRGKLELAHESTIFFDEVGDMSLLSQAKILRVLDSGEVYPLGTHRRLSVDLRVVAATNQDLERLVPEGRFRADLLFRLNVARVRLPALRERRDDIPLLLSHFVRRFAAANGRGADGFSEEAVARLTAYAWPGNVRELRNLVERQFLDSDTDRFGVENLPDEIRQSAAVTRAAPVAAERDRILEALAATNWNKSAAAAQLKWSRMTLYRKLARMATGSVTVTGGVTSPITLRSSAS